MLPRFLIIGAQKCGTTWLHHHLANHPALFLPEGKDDEFFSYQPARPLADYRRKFAAAPDGVLRGDSCASYLWSPHPEDRQPEHFNPAIPATVRDALGADCRLIVLLKDPVARTLSAYLHHLACGSLSANHTLFDAPPELGLVALSRYGWHLRHWLATFPPEQLLVVPDPGSTDARALLRQVTTFLGVADEDAFSDAERVVYGGLRRRLDDSGLWVTVGQPGLDSLEAIQRPCPILEHEDATEVRLVDPAEIAQLRATLRADTADFAVLAETYRWTDPAFGRWRSWPGTVENPGGPETAVAPPHFPPLGMPLEYSRSAPDGARHLQQRSPPARPAIAQPPASPPTNPHMPSRIRILAGRGARFLYRRLPLPLPVKWRIKSFLYRHLGSLLKGSAS